MRKIKGTFIGKAAALTAGLVLSAIAAGSVFAQTSPTQAEASDKAPSYTSSIQVAGQETEEAMALISKAKISMAEAQKIALAANAGTKVVKSELDNENGNLVFSITLDNGLDVRVDAGNGRILFSQQADQHDSERDGEGQDKSSSEEGNTDSEK